MPKSKEKKLWKEAAVEGGRDVAVPCKASVKFVRIRNRTTNLDGYEFCEEQPQHNHLRDKTILPNSVIFYLDDYVSQFGMNSHKLDAMSVAVHLQEAFKREFDMPSLFHHLSQRFDIKHDS